MSHAAERTAAATGVKKEKSRPDYSSKQRIRVRIYICVLSNKDTQAVRIIIYVYVLYTTLDMNKCNECSHININTKFNYIPVCVSSLVVYVLNCEVSFARLRATYDLKEYIFYVLHDRYASCHRVNSKACCTGYVRGIRTRSRSCAAGR